MADIFAKNTLPAEQQFRDDFSGGNEFFDKLLASYQAKRPDYTSFQKAENKTATARNAAAAKRAASRNAGAEGQTQMNAQGDAEAGSMADYASTDATINSKKYADVVKQLLGTFGAAQKGRAFNRSAASTGQSYQDRLNAMKQGVILGNDQMNNEALNGAISGAGNLAGGLINYFMGKKKDSRTSTNDAGGSPVQNDSTGGW